MFQDGAAVSNPDGLLADDVILVQQLEAPDGIDRERFVADEAQAVHGSITKLNVNGLLLATSAARAVQLAFASNDEATVSALSAGLMVISNRFELRQLIQHAAGVF